MSTPASPLPTVPAPSDYVSVVMERNFLARALSDLNFHNNAHDGIVFLDQQHNVVYANPYFIEMIGAPNPASVLGKPLETKLWEDPAAATKMLADVVENGFVREREMVMYNLNQQPIFAVCSSVASHDDDGSIIGIEMMLCNITGKRRVEAELRARTKLLERVTAFATTTLDTLSDMVERGASAREMRDIVRDLQRELARLNPTP